MVLVVVIFDDGSGSQAVTVVHVPPGTICRDAVARREAAAVRARSENRIVDVGHLDGHPHHEAIQGREMAGRYYKAGFICGEMATRVHPAVTLRGGNLGRYWGGSLTAREVGCVDACSGHYRWNISSGAVACSSVPVPGCHTATDPRAGDIYPWITGRDGEKRVFLMGQASN